MHGWRGRGKAWMVRWRVVAVRRVRRRKRAKRRCIVWDGALKV